MGGVDLLDGLLSLYRIHIRSKKWYHKLLYHFFDIAVVQSWLLYWRDLKLLSISEIEWMPLRSFKMSIANSLLMKDKRQRERTPGRPWTSRLEKDLSAKKTWSSCPDPNKPIRLDLFVHISLHTCVMESMVDVNYQGVTKLLELSAQNAKLIYVSLQNEIASSISIHIDVTSFIRQFINRKSWFEQLIFYFVVFKSLFKFVSQITLIV